MKRLLTAAVLVPLVVYVVLAANFWIFLAVVALVACICYREFDAIAAAYGFGAPGPLGYAAGILLLVWRQEPWVLIALLTLGALIVVMGAPELAKSLPRAALLVTGLVYIFGCWRAAISLHDINPHWLMFALLVNWTGDAGAYYVGRPFGRHKLAPRVSPNKSWEGAIASTVVSLIVAGGYLLYFLPEAGALFIIPLAILANVTGQLGDLAESAMKRGAGVKDSGSLLPGHGGLLDRVDSTMFVLPVVYACVHLTL
jgi:phosphatidate cytidylyltransferase